MKISNAIFAIVMYSIHITGTAQTINCDEIKKFKPKGIRESHAKIELQLDNIQSLSYTGVMSSGEEGGAYFCDLELKRGDQRTNWENNGSKTTITIAPIREENPSTIEILRDKNTVAIKFNVSPSEYCGFGAEFPSKMIKTPGGKCKAHY